ncbi:MAG: LacI family transcriptional regulator [Spirochaetia bacterium]|jgi:LacI family transcriptional regulator|nr:LacI family transcriptional regulator [Spirochaetia bacterium]
MSDKITNLKVVAEAAGVSISTVSRVLADKQCVQEKTRQRVFETAKRLGYVPNELAKSLKTGTSNTIALMIPSIQNMIYPDIVRGVEDIARKYGFIVILCNTDEDCTIEQSYITKLRTHWIEGFVVASMMADSTHIVQLHESGFPVVLACRYYGENMDAVLIDNVKAAFDATQYLIRTGRKKIAFAQGRSDLAVYTDRFEGYKQALAVHDIPFDPRLVIQETQDLNSLYYYTQKLVRSSARPDAIFASNDQRALIIQRALHDEHILIPKEIAVLGFDNVEISSLAEPPLSTVSQPLYRIGALAAKRLIHQINYRRKYGKMDEPLVDILPTDIIIRSST